METKEVDIILYSDYDPLYGFELEVKTLQMNMDKIAEKPAKGHIATACKAIQKQIDKNLEKRKELIVKSGALLKKAQDLETENEGLLEQIKRLKGDSSVVSDLKQITSNLK